MAKKAKTKAAKSAVVAPTLMPAPINWSGPVQDRKIVKAKPAISEFVLNDGTKLTVKAIVVDVKRAMKQYNQHGQPLYFCAIANTITTTAPKKLRKK